MGTKLIMLKKEVSEDEFIARNPGDDQLCILDLETTGFDPEDSEIVEIFILKVIDIIILLLLIVINIIYQ